MRTRNRQSRGMTLIEVLIVVALIGLITGILIPNLLDGLHKSIQKRTVADIHAVAIAMVAFHTDMHGAAAAGSHVGDAVFLEDHDPISWAEVSDILVPAYIDRLPITDPWGGSYDYYYGTFTAEYGYELSFGMRSRGKDGVADDVAYLWGAFDPIHYDWDILWLDGLFVTWPAHQGEKTGGGGCNQGLGNGAEGCDPANSNRNQTSNDEGDGNRGGGG